MWRSEQVEKGELRCDAPTTDPECHLLLSSFASTMKWKVCAALLMSPPRGRLSKYDPEVPAGSLLLRRVPIYGTRDAGRGFHFRMDSGVKQAGHVASHVAPATYFLRSEEGTLDAMTCARVDDLLFCRNDVGKKKAQQILGRFSVGKMEEKGFRYCGRRFFQEDDFTIHVDVQENMIIQDCDRWSSWEKGNSPSDIQKS